MADLSIFANQEDSALTALPKASARMALSIVRSWRYMSEELAEKLLSLVNADTLWSLCLILAAWVIATVIGGPIAVAIDGLLILYGLYSIYEQLSATWGALRAWATSAYNAKDDAGLEQAAKFFAKAAAEGGIDILAAILTHKVFSKAQSGLTKRFPTPRWLRDELAAAESERRAAKARKPDEAEKRGVEESAEQQRRAKKEERPRIEDPVVKALNLARGAGASNLAQGGSALTGALIGGAVLFGVGTAIAIASVGGGSGKKRSR